MDVSMEEVVEVSADAPPMKKFKQVRLPFKPITVKSQVAPTTGNKKRKLSDQESPSAKAPKTIKQVAVADKFKAPGIVENDPEVSSSSEAENLPMSSLQKAKSTRSNILERFVRKISQEEITSTNDAVEESVHSTSSKTPEKPLLTKEVDRLSVGKTSTPKQIKTFKNVAFKSDQKKSIAENIEDVVEISDDDIVKDAADKTGDAADKVDDATDKADDATDKVDNTEEKPEEQEENQSDDSFNKSSSLDESKIDVSLLSSPGKSSTGGMDSSMCETPSTVDASNSGKTPTAKKPRTVSKLSEKKKQERTEMRIRIKEQKEKERADKKQQKENELQEKKQKLEEFKLEKERLKKEEKEKKERERQEKLDKIEKEKVAKQQVKEEEKRKKQESLDAKQEEKRKKDEEKKLKDEEKKLKDEEKRKDEAVKSKKESKVKAAFEGFFVKHNKPVPKPIETKTADICKYYEVKKDTYRAPRVWRLLDTTVKSNLSTKLHSQESSSLYIDSLKNRSHKPLKADPEQYRQKKDLEEDLIIHDSETVKKVTHHVKYLFFHKNHRPPYYGTWRKKSDKLRPRNPFKMDNELFDYEVDSDDEWEEEEPGESLSASEGEDNDDKEKEDDEDDDSGWMVPHGYLSEDECADDDKEITPEVLKLRQQAKADQWEAELKRQCQPVKTIVIGCYWQDEDNKIEKSRLDILDSFTAVCLTSLPVNTPLSINKLSSTSDTPGRDKCATPNNCKMKTKSVPEEAIPDLIKLLHGNTLGIKKLIHEFRVYWKQKTETKNNDDSTPMDTDSPKTILNESIKEDIVTPAKDDEFSISKRQLDIKINALATREKRSCFKKVCWHVHEDMLKQHNLLDLTYPNKWQYLTIKRDENEPVEMTVSAKTDEDANTSVCEETLTPKPLPRDQRSIMDFAKKVDHPPEITAKPPPVQVAANKINGAKTAETIKVIKPTVLSLLNAAAKPGGVKTPVTEVHAIKTSPSAIKTSPSADTAIVKDNNKQIVSKIIEPMDYNEDSNGCILLD